MSSVVISGDTSGAITLSAPAVAGTNTITLPAATGTAMVSGNMPAFSAYKSGGNQSISINTYVKITFETEVFDTNNNFASSTFTPTVAGYYQINACATLTGGATESLYLTCLYKNGSEIARTTANTGTFVMGDWGQMVSSVIYMNGTTDYLDVYGYTNCPTSPVIYNGQKFTYFNGVLIRAA